MERTTCIAAATLAFALVLGAQQPAPQQPAPQQPAPEPIEDSNVTFKSDVNLVRVDVQVLSSTNQPITTLRREDFRLSDNNQLREISSLSRESVPMDIVLLLDVSGSMRPHVERVGSAAHQALTVLGNKDRVAIMTFDRTSRVILPFSANHDDVTRGFQNLLDREDFNGGTDIHRGMVDSIRYLKQNARPGSRRAVIILTDDVSERPVDEYGIGRDLENANATMSALIAPDAMGHRQQIPTTSRRGGGGMSMPDIIFGRRWPTGGPTTPGGRLPGGVIIGNGRMHSGATPRIARSSGGDSLDVGNVSALEDTLERLRQSYALYFNAAEGSTAGQQRNIDIRLAGAAANRYPNAQLIYRGSYNAVEGAVPVGDAPPPSQIPPTVSRNDDDDSRPAPRMKRRPAVNESGSNGGWRRAESVPQQQPEPAPAPKVEPTPAPAPEPSQPQQSSGGFRRVKPGEKP
jgi:VWFA-related protein